MKPDSVLIFLIFNSILWSLINSVKINKNQQELSRVEKTSKNLDKAINDRAESSVAPQIEKYKGSLKPNAKVTKKHKTENNEKEKRLKKNEYLKDYYQQHKKEKQDYNRNYQQNNKEKRRAYKQKYYLKKKNEQVIIQNDDFIRRGNTGNNVDVKKLAKKEYNKNYYQNNKEKLRESSMDKNEMRREYNKKYYLRRINEKENSLNDNNINKGKLPIECNENVQVNNKEGNDNSEGNSYVNQHPDEGVVNNLNNQEQENVQQLDDGHPIPLNCEMNDLEYLKFLNDLNFLDNQNYLF